MKGRHYLKLLIELGRGSVKVQNLTPHAIMSVNRLLTPPISPLKEKMPSFIKFPIEKSYHKVEVVIQERKENSVPDGNTFRYRDD